MKYLFVVLAIVLIIAGVVALLVEPTVKVAVVCAIGALVCTNMAHVVKN